MKAVNRIILKIRRKETPFYSRVNRFLKAVMRLEMPLIRPVHGFLYRERLFRITAFRWLGVKLYYEPLFKSQCLRVGNNFRIVRGKLQGIPLILGKPLIEIGDDVTIHSVITFAAGKVFDEPIIRIGNNSYIGSRVSISVAKEVSIGDNCYIADNIIIRDNDGHPIDKKKRYEEQPVIEEDVKPVKIGGHVWIGSGSIILKGVQIHEGAIVGSGSVVTRDVPPFSIVAGNPAKVVKTLNDRE